MGENFRSCIAGGAGGMAAVVAGHPLDTMKVKIQCYSEPVCKVCNKMRPDLCSCSYRWENVSK